MGMLLAPGQLVKIAEKVNELGKVDGLDIREVMIEGHKVFLTKTDTGYQVRGISNEVNHR